MKKFSYQVSKMLEDKYLINGDEIEWVLLKE